MSPDPLIEILRKEIRARGPIPFQRYMELALYAPRGGYYERGPEVLGERGDFITASDMGTHLGRALAQLLAELDTVAGPFAPFDLLEFGAGRGLLMRDILDAAADRHPDLAHRLRCTLIERSAAMRAAAARVVPEAEVAEHARPVAGSGAALAVELFDALPVHRVRRRGGALVEIHVGLDDHDRLVEVEAVASDGARRLAEHYGAAPREGDTAEVAPAADEQLARMAGALERGLLLVVDYGDLASALYGPARAHGTLLAYRGHRTHQDFYGEPGRSDLTAHVNLSQLCDRGRELGLTLLARTTQDRLLVANGLLDTFAATDDSTWRSPGRVRQRQEALWLLHPAGMGRTFRVLVWSKGLTPPPDLRGVRDPFASTPFSYNSSIENTLL